MYICIYTITLSNDASSINANVIRNTAGTVANLEDQQYSQIIQDMAMGYPLKSEFYEYSVEELGKLYKDIVKQERAFIGTITGMNRKKEKIPQYQTDIDVWRHQENLLTRYKNEIKDYLR